MSNHVNTHAPRPEPNDPCLRIVIERAKEILEEEGAETAILWAAVHGWMEGHIEAHGCNGTETVAIDGGETQTLEQAQQVRAAMRSGKNLMSKEQLEEAARQMGVRPEHFAKTHNIQVV